jgi:hypothetical protein
MPEVIVVSDDVRGTWAVHSACGYLWICGLSEHSPSSEQWPPSDPLPTMNGHVKRRRKKRRLTQSKDLNGERLCISIGESLDILSQA